MLEKHPATIGFLVEAAARALRGDSINSVAAYLDDVAPRTGRVNAAARWTITVTRRMLQNPILAGMTLHNPGNTGKARGPEVLRDDDGMPIIREDLAILSPEEFRALRNRLDAPAPYTTPVPSYLAGLVWCGHCNRKMHRNAKTVRGKKVRVFQCQGPDGCGQQVAHLEEIVERVFLAQNGNSPFVSIRHKSDDRDLSEIDAQIRDTLARMSHEEEDVIALAQRLQALRAVRKRTPEPEYEYIQTDRTAAEMWATDPRSALLNWYAGVRLVKGKVGRKFDESRLSFIRHDVPRVDPADYETHEEFDAALKQLLLGV